MACQAGKDVYCEKPMCLTVAEAKAMVEAAERYKRITQVGTQIHAGQNFRRVVEIVRSGMLGKITSRSDFCR
jgi:predicted dehydrogenase